MNVRGAPLQVASLAAQGAAAALAVNTSGEVLKSLTPEQIKASGQRMHLAKGNAVKEKDVQHQPEEV